MLKFSEITKILENDVELPIKPERIASIIRERTEIKTIVFVGVDLDTEVLRGLFVRIMFDDLAAGGIPRPYTIPDTKRIAKIYYARNGEPDEVRVAVNKELLHITDPDPVRTCTPEDARMLIDSLRLPVVAMIDDGNLSISALIDHLADYRAVMAMAPERIRDLSCQKHAEGKITEDEISNLLGIPRRYVPVLLHQTAWSRLKRIWMRI